MQLLVAEKHKPREISEELTHKIYIVFLSPLSLPLSFSIFLSLFLSLFIYLSIYV